jgi:hypothetical protein
MIEQLSDPTGCLNQQRRSNKSKTIKYYREKYKDCDVAVLDFKNALDEISRFHALQQCQIHFLTLFPFLRAMYSYPS